MKIHYHLCGDIIFADKPAGFSTHSPDAGKLGFTEILSQQLGRKLFVVHRLDKTTTGIMCFALTEQAAQKASASFLEKSVHKRYWFVTDRISGDLNYQVISTISKSGKNFINAPAETRDQANAETLFRRIKRSPFFELWEATPKTGKPHQIRLHASQVGLPILGDTLYGGSPFPALCLHATELKLPDSPLMTSPAPRFFERLGVLKDPELCAVLAAIDRRQRLYNFLAQPEESLRLLHSESSDYRLDLFGAQLWLYWYRETPPTERDLERWQFVSKLLSRPLLIRKMQNRGEDPTTKTEWAIGDVLLKWNAKENSDAFTLDCQAGLSPGLFLDQRLNRERVKQNSANKKVLNLFSYTCGFSLKAALGGAQEVVSVDLSRKFLEWGKENFRANQLDPDKFQFFSLDSEVFLKGAIKRNRKFDIIICDPPSFGRKDNSVFRIERNLPDLLELCWQVLNPGGKILVSCNYEKWNQSQFEIVCRKSVGPSKVIPLLLPWDFELPNEERLLKCLMLEKKSN